MMEQEGMQEGEPYIVMNVMIEVYYKDRAEPQQIMTDFRMAKSLFADADDPLALFSHVCLSSVTALLNTKGEHLMVFSDAKYNRYVVMIDEVQSISILAPEDTHIKELLAQAD